MPVKEIESIMKKIKNTLENQAKQPDIALTKSNVGGFTLIEVIIAMVILMIVLLGVFVSFTYAVNYNAGNNSRSQALAVLQQEVELLRSAKFTPSITDANLLGGVQASRVVSSADGNRFRVQITIDDDPFTAGVQTDTTKTLKEIALTVTLENPTPGWQTAVPAMVILRRVRAN
jgi:prepilin-type N-terminal cleavage/methylation domain-containing protein